MTKDEALKLARTALGVQLDALLGKAGHLRNDDRRRYAENGIKAIDEALAQPEQEPVAWLITDEKINSLQVGSIQRLIDRARHAHMTDIKLRINGQDEWYEADWLKHLTRTTPPQRKPLTAMEVYDVVHDADLDWHTGFALGEDENRFVVFARAIEAAHGIKGEA